MKLALKQKVKLIPRADDNRHPQTRIGIVVINKQNHYESDGNFYRYTVQFLNDETHGTFYGFELEKINSKLFYNIAAGQGYNRETVTAWLKKVYAETDATYPFGEP